MRGLTQKKSSGFKTVSSGARAFLSSGTCLQIYNMCPKKDLNLDLSSGRGILRMASVVIVEISYKNRFV